ncbi:MAG TPA: hypothetical protein VMF06_15460 [Candidatus Limnocylindria bacterium]|nr:hypothetical protein [Candidatus Limnocylindria bacterium]
MTRRGGGTLSANGWVDTRLLEAGMLRNATEQACNLLVLLVFAINEQPAAFQPNLPEAW